FGGNVAFEMAHQLSRENQEVGIVAMLDTFGPGYPEFESGFSLLKIKFLISLKRYRKHFRILFSSDQNARKEYFRYYRDFLPGEFSRQWRNLKLRLRKVRADSIAPELKLVEQASLAARKRYTPPDYDGEVILFRAKHQLPGVKYDPLLGWGKANIGNLVVPEVDAVHGDILFQPAISTVYEFLLPYFQKYQ
ncbi:MAG: hypothetical protein N2F24_11840, partial [Deltaproteobacteria bacterium]